METTIKQSYRSGIGCHDNFVKAKDAARAILKYDAYDVLNVFYLPTLKDVVVYYKLWNEVMSWLKHKLCATMFTSQCL